MDIFIFVFFIVAAFLGMVVNIPLRGKSRFNRRLLMMGVLFASFFIAGGITTVLEFIF